MYESPPLCESHTEMYDAEEDDHGENDMGDGELSHIDERSQSPMRRRYVPAAVHAPPESPAPPEWAGRPSLPPLFSPPPLKFYTPAEPFSPQSVNNVTPAPRPRAENPHARLLLAASPPSPAALHDTSICRPVPRTAPILIRPPPTSRLGMGQLALNKFDSPTASPPPVPLLGQNRKRKSPVPLPFFPTTAEPLSPTFASPPRSRSGSSGTFGTPPSPMAMGLHHFRRRQHGLSVSRDCTPANSPDALSAREEGEAWSRGVKCGRNSYLMDEETKGERSLGCSPLQRQFGGMGVREWESRRELQEKKQFV